MFVLKTRLESELKEIDEWVVSLGLGDETIGKKLMMARFAVRETIELIAACEELMPEEER